MIYTIVWFIVTVGMYAGFRFYFGKRMYMNEDSYITIREYVLAMLLVGFVTIGEDAIGFSPLPFFTLGMSVLGLGILWAVRNKEEETDYFLFLHRLASVSFLLLVPMDIVFMVLSLLKMMV